jgi:hypothetical protein
MAINATIHTAVCTALHTKTAGAITIVSSMLRTLELSDNIGLSCGSTDYPVCV